jgi:hypothetical protein
VEKNPVVTFYPNRAWLTRVLLVHVFMVVVLVLEFVFGALHPDRLYPERTFLGTLISTLLIPCIIGFCVGEFYRLAHWTPALIVDDEGVIDNGSCIVCGVGRIRWEDMYALVPREGYNKYRGGPRLFGPYLVVQLRYRDAFVGGLAPTIRVLRWMRRWNPGDISIPQFMLDDAVPGIMSDIRGRYERLRHEPYTTAHKSPEVRMPY